MVETNDLGDDEIMTDSFKGATYRVKRGDGGMYDIELILHTPTDGFQVGAINGTYVQTHTPLELNALLRTCAYVHPNADYVGYWLDDEGMYHIDPSHYYSEADYMDAIADARSLNQKAIWSFIQAAEVAVAPTPLQQFGNASETPSEGSESPSMKNTIKQLAQRGYAVLRVDELEDLIQRNREASERSRELRKGSNLGTRAVDDVVVLDFEISDDEEVMSAGRHQLQLDLEASKF